MAKKLVLPLIFVTVLLCVAYVKFTENKTASQSETEASSGEALIGGAFELTDNKGNKFSEASLRGKKYLVFFGFTHCPDICPVAIATISDTLNKVENVSALFITVDPERDTVEVMDEYLLPFNKNIVGLTGTKPEVEKVEKLYKAYAQKSDAHDGKYMMNHSDLIYLMDENGKYITHFNRGNSSEEIVAKLKK
jgi:protein SCO1/2